MAQLHIVARAALLAILAALLARLFWVAVTPIGPVGEWRPPTARLPVPAVRTALLGNIDPFGRSGPATTDPNLVTSLDLELFGIRQNLGAGTGSAIIGTPDGEQMSFAVGEEIMPGATLAEVAFDHVVIDRGGLREKLFLDESEPAQLVGGAAESAAVASDSSADLTAGNVAEAVNFSPRTRGNSVTGIRVMPGSNRELWDATGLQPGDVIVQVNGVSVTSSSDLEQLRREMRPGARLTLSVERGANVLPIALSL